MGEIYSKDFNMGGIIYKIFTKDEKLKSIVDSINSYETLLATYFKLIKKDDIHLESDFKVVNQKLYFDLEITYV